MSTKTWTIIILANLLVLGGAAVYIAWLADRIKLPKFNIDQAAVNNFNFTNDNNLTVNFIFVIRSHNIDSKYTLFYDHLAVSVYHNNYSLGFEMLGAFAENDRRDDIVFTTHPRALNVHISDARVAADIRNETTLLRQLEVEVMIRASVNFEAKGWKRKQYLLKMMCFPLFIDLKTGKSSNNLDCKLDNYVTA